MIGRIVSLQGQPSSIAQAHQAFASQGAGILKSLPGLEALHVFFRPTEGRAAIVSVWKDATTAMSAVQAMSAMQQKMIGLGLTFKLEDYDVVV